jgi:hypothetical protein
MPGPARQKGVPEPRPLPFMRLLPPRVLVPVAALLLAVLLIVLAAWVS